MQPTVTEAPADPQDPFAPLAAELARRLPADEVAGATDLLRRAYASTPPDELGELGVDAVVGPVVALWKLGQERQPGQVNIRVYNPQQGRDGWSSPHTAIDVVNDDMPFLLASTKTELQRQQRGTHMVLHPVLGVERDAGGKLRRLLPRSEGIGESWMHFEIDRETTGEEGLVALAARLREVLTKVRVVVEDWRPMIAKVKEIEAELRHEPPPAVPADEVEEAAELLRWLLDNHFTFLGYRRYRLARAQDGSHLRREDGPGLGIHREMSPSEERRGARLPDYLDSWLRQRELLIINKASTKSEVHRPVHIDSIGIRHFDEQGNVVGEDRFSGIFTTRVYSSSAASIPMLRRKLRRVTERANFSPGSHDAKGLVRVIEGFPRDELFQISEDDLFRIAVGILQLEQRQRVALFVRRDELERFISALVFVPRDRYSSELREKLGRILAQELGGPVVAFYTTVGDAPLARVQYIFVTKPGEVPRPDLRQLEAKLAVAARTWREELRDQLVAAHGEEEGLRLLAAWGEAFPAVYRERFGAADALADVEVAEAMLASGEEFAARLYRSAEMPPPNEDHRRVRVKLYLAGRQVALTDALPLLENLGVRVEEELPFEVRVAAAAGANGARAVWIHDFALVARGDVVDFDTAKPLLEETLRRVWRGELENGVLNRLVLAAGLHWRQVAMLRAYSRYLRQIGMTFSQTYIAQTMVQHREVSQLLVQLFCTLFDPAGQEDSRSRAAAILAQVREKLETVASLDEDRILRGFMTVIKETLRTNFFQTGPDGHHQPYVSFKLDSRGIRQLPDPKPRFEIFVYSPRMEGVHLRGGMVARGGIRWSDRREDFRTEILGLLKAQMVKNAVIVPVGAKGGFVVKRPPTAGGREAVQAEGIECYKTLVRGMLDVTDNIQDGEVVHPPDVVRRDGDDSYLVVAADKGTATFSDIANGLSADYRHWLGDAFASGGSAGYDHKKMGITARGAWVAVQRHFREMGRDIQNEPFTCVGVGDMSGDVFGNGMLLSRHTRLIAAFDHRHIFVDPDPDEEKSFEERKWLFEQPRSSWADYDRALLSPGGDVFERTAKQVTLSDEAAAALGLGSKKKLTPTELVQAILTAAVDLLWLGGIGTFVKASGERHGDVGDRANDATRVDATALRCKVVGEGANLGFTQRARIEYALSGGRINSDAIDNSAGVDTSDHEVNIKIALNEAVRAGKLSGAGRNDLLRQMTDEVAALVLRDNYLQTQAISLTESMAPQLLDRHAQMIRAFERSGRLDRKLEFLPDEETIRQRAASKRGLVRPELAVLLAYAKIALYDDLLASDVPDDPLLGGDLLRYFPQPMVEGYRDEIERHRLRREIIATYITNSTINRVGPSFVFRMMESTGRSAQEVARAYAITRDAFELRKAWAAVEALDNKVPAELQLRMLQEVRQLTEQSTLWFLQRYDGALDVSEVVGTYGPPLQELARELEGLLPAGARRELKKRARDYVRQGVPEKLAQQVAVMRGLLAGTDVVRLALAMEAPAPEVARVFFGVGERLGGEWLRAAAAAIKVETPWQRAAIEGLLDDLSLHQVAITWQVLAEAGRKAEWRQALQAWEARHVAEVGRLDKLLEELQAQEAVDLAMLAVADRQLQLLAAR
jgi:glutamate dehydrogenase